MATLDTLQKVVERLERKVDLLNEQRQKPKWVKASIVSSVTGWKQEKLRQAREKGYIKYETRKEVKEDKIVNAFWYDLNSLDARFYK
jgi:hypothetical protein